MTDSNSTTAGRKPAKKKQIDFIVTTSDPNSASNAANKKRVRSVAALKSWPERRKKIFEQLENTNTCSGGHGAFVLENHEIYRRKSKTPPKNLQSGQQQVSPPTSCSAPKRAKVYGPPPPARRTSSAAYALNSSAGTTLIPDAVSPPGDLSCHLDPAIQQQLSAIGSSMGLYRNFFTTLVSPTTQDVPAPSDTASLAARKKRMADGSEKPTEIVGTIAMITPPSSPTAGASSHQLDPFNNCPVTYRPWFDMILHHMITVYAPRGWPALKITSEQGVKWEWFMTQNALAEPALFYVRLLFGSGDMIRLGALSAEVMYWLRAEAIKAINEALGDPKRNCSDGLILAVGRIALHEHMYGDKFASSHVHRPAQRRMIDLRGGMKALQFPDLVKRLMRWSDRIMAVGSGTERLLEDDELNPNFSLKQSVGAIEGWAPHEMPGVRSKIRISDLVNDEDET